MSWGLRLIHRESCPQRCYFKYKPENKSKLQPAPTPRMPKNLIRTLKLLSFLWMSGPTRSVLKCLALLPRTSCRVHRAFLSSNASGKVRDVATCPRWRPHPQLISLLLPLNHPPETPSFLDRPGHPGPLTSNSRCPAGCWFPGGQGPIHTQQASGAQHLICWLYQSNLVPSLDWTCLTLLLRETLPGSLNTAWRGKEGLAWNTRASPPYSRPGRSLCSLSTVGVPPLWNACSLLLQSTQESRLISHSGSNLSLLWAPQCFGYCRHSPVHWFIHSCS